MEKGKIRIKDRKKVSGGKKGKRNSRSNIKTLLKLAKVGMRDPSGPSDCLSEVTITPRITM